MSEEIVENEEIETPVEDSTKRSLTDEETSVDTGSATPESETEEEQETDWEQRAKELEEKAKKWESTAQNYKKENEKYRKPKKIAVEKTEVGEPSSIINDYQSKVADISYDMREEMESISDEQWKYVKPMIDASFKNLLEKATENNTRVARGELKEAVKKFISFAKSSGIDQDKARLKELEAKNNLNNAELGGVKKNTGSESSSKVKILNIDKKRSAETGRTLEREAELRIARQKRTEEYAVKDPLKDYNL